MEQNRTECLSASDLVNSTMACCGEETPADKSGLQLFTYVINYFVIMPLCIFGIICNILSIIVLTKDNRKSVTFLFLKCLAVADNCELVAVLFIYVLPLSVKFPTQMDLWGYPIAMMIQTITILLVVIVTVDRYIAICMPTKVRSISTITRARLQVLCVVIFSIIFHIPRFFDHKLVEELNPCTNETKLVIKPEPFNNRTYHLVYTVFLYSFVNFIIPLIILTYLNVKLILTLKHARRERKTMTHNSKKMSTGNADRSVTLMLVLVVIVFTICQLPALFTQIWSGFRDESNSNLYRYIGEVTNFMVTLNSSTNFIIYCIFGQKFRELMCLTFCGRCRKMPKRTQRHIEMSDMCSTDYTMTTTTQIPSNFHMAEYNNHESSTSLMIPKNGDNGHV